MASSYIISGCRTPIGKFLGGLSTLSAPKLGGIAIRQAIDRAKIDVESIDHVLMGQVLQAGCGQAPARQASVHAGIPTHVGCATINKVCGSGLYTAMLADMAIRAGEYRCVVAGGMESMSQSPHLLKNGRSGWKYGDQVLGDAIDVDGLRCAQLGLAMGCIGEWEALESHVSRADQDQWAASSHRRAVDAQFQGAFSNEIVEIAIRDSKRELTIGQDETPRKDCTIEGLAQLKPIFVSKLVQEMQSKDYTGTVTAGNASSLSDGAAAVIVVDESLLSKACGEFVYRIVGHHTFATNHQSIFTAPVGAILGLIKKTKLSLEDVDLFEVNEAFASQTLACIRALNLEPASVNANGGAIALGHPLGCSGARILVTLMHQLHARKLKRGIASLCLGGGEAVAMMIERV